MLRRLCSCQHRLAPRQQRLAVLRGVIAAMQRQQAGVMCCAAVNAVTEAQTCRICRAASTRSSSTAACRRDSKLASWSDRCDASTDRRACSSSSSPWRACRGSSSSSSIAATIAATAGTAAATPRQPAAHTPAACARARPVLTALPWQPPHGWPGQSRVLRGPVLPPVRRQQAWRCTGSCWGLCKSHSMLKHAVSRCSARCNAATSAAAAAAVDASGVASCLR